MGTNTRTDAPSIQSDYLTIPEVGAYCRHAERTVWRWLANGWLPFHRVAGGRRVLVKRCDVDALLEAGRIEPRATKVSATHARPARR
jgi:excisionase family DNA binding protein